METIDLEQFEREWVKLVREICQALYTTPRAQELKHNLQKNGTLSLEESSEFIELCDKVKYDIIYGKYGPEGSEGYKEFMKNWQEWFRQKGVESEKGRTQRHSVQHLLYGSTPDPVRFLLHFEEEMLGSMSEKKVE